MVNNIVTIVFNKLTNFTTLLTILLQYCYFVMILWTTLRAVISKAGDNKNKLSPSKLQIEHVLNFVLVVIKSFSRKLNSMQCGRLTIKSKLWIKSACFVWKKEAEHMLKLNCLFNPTTCSSFSVTRCYIWCIKTVAQYIKCRSNS